MARDFSKNLSNKLSLGVNAVSPLMEGAGAICVHALIYVDTFNVGAGLNQILNVLNNSADERGLEFYLAAGDPVVTLRARSQPGEGMIPVDGTTAVPTGTWVAIGARLDFAGDAANAVFVDGVSDGNSPVGWSSSTYQTGIGEGGGDFDANLYGTPLLWLDADQDVEEAAGNPAEDNDLVYWWRDQADDFDFVMTNAGWRPIFRTGIINGRSVVRFDGVDDFLDRATSDNLGAFTSLTLFYVLGNVTSETERIVHWYVDNANNRMFYLQAATGAVEPGIKFRVYYDNGGGPQNINVSSAHDPANPTVVTVTLEAAAVRLYINNVLAQEVTAGAPYSWSDDGVDPTAHYLGGYSSTSSWLAGDQAQIVVYGAMSAANRSAAAQSLMQEYDIGTSPPATLEDRIGSVDGGVVSQWFDGRIAELSVFRGDIGDAGFALLAKRLPPHEIQLPAVHFTLVGDELRSQWGGLEATITGSIPILTHPHRCNPQTTIPQSYGNIEYAATSPPGPSYLLHDLFDDTNGTDLPAHTPDEGGPWVELAGGGFTIQANEAVSDAHANNNNVVDVGASDVTITLSLRTPAAGSPTSYQGIVARAVSSLNHWRIVINAVADLFAIIQVIDGAAYILASTSVTIHADTEYEIICTVLGTGITTTINGANELNYTSAAYQTETKHGIYTGASANGAFLEIEIV